MRGRLVLLVTLLATGVAFAGGQKDMTKPAAGSGPAAGPSQAKEAPMLAELVKAGKLPPLKDRLPAEPLVVRPEQIGKYGGIIRAGAFGPKSGGLDDEVVRVQNLFQIEPDLKTITPNIVKSFEIAKDFKSMTIVLRKGMKWSDGAPFTADDFMFWYQDVAQNKDLVPTPNILWTPGGQLWKQTKVDDVTLRYEFAAPYPAIDIVFAKSHSNGRLYQPKHYLQKWHIKYNPQAGDLAKQEGYQNWFQTFLAHMSYGQDQQDPNLPVVDPWRLKSIDVSGNKYSERNPYYWKVDTAGNQLPYIDEQQRILVQNAEVRVLKFISGELHNAGENPLPVKDYTLYKENEQKGSYSVFLFENTRGSDCSFSFNLTHKDPVLRKVFNDVKFRQAMSLAINRKQINDVLYYGKAMPYQATTPPITSFYEDWMGKQFIEFDQAKANALLDEIGLKWDAEKKGRLRPDGQPLKIVLEATEEFFPMSELVAEHWTKVGIQTTVKQEERTFFYSRGPANERDAQAWTYDGAAEFNMRQGGGRLRPPWGSPIDAAPLWQAWFESKGATGEQPPEIVRKNYDLMNQFNAAVPGSPEYMKLGKEILTNHAQNLWIIGTTVAPRVILLSNKLGNAPKKGTFAADFMFWIPYKGDQWFFK